MKVKEAKGSGAGLFSAAMIAIVPAYISRSVAGSYDNEGVAIFALVLTYGMWIKSVKTGSIFWSAITSLVYFYMVAAWGGYVFIINLIPFYVFIILLSGRFNSNIYIAYSIFYVLGTIFAMQVTFVGFQAVTSSEHFASFGIFGLIQIYQFLTWFRSLIKKNSHKTFERLLLAVLALLIIALLVIGKTSNLISPWTGRFYSMFDPTFAKKFIPIIASVSEHQPTIWASYLFDLHILLFFSPVGIYFCFKDLTDAKLFLVIYATTSFYFASVMVRLMLVLAPIACILSGIAISSILQIYLIPKTKLPEKFKALAMPKELSFLMVIGILYLLLSFTLHCNWITSEAYSSPSIVIASRTRDGFPAYLDDFRGAYRWLNFNTPPDARIMSWWDYGYQMAAMANRTVLVDNNTWNNSHIAQVGKAMSSTEPEAYKIMLALDVDYVLVIFGGMIGYSGDDINKFLWMVRIAGGVYPEIQEPQYFTKQGEFRVDSGGSPVLLNCLMYKLCYYRFGEVLTDPSKPLGFDKVRNVEIGNKNIKFEHLEEVYTSENWLVRIYKVKRPNNHKIYPYLDKNKYIN